MAPSSHNADAFWGITLFLATSSGAAFLPFVGISLTLDTFGGEATCYSPDVVAVSSAHSAWFVTFWLTTSFSAVFSLCGYFFDFRYFWGWSNMFLTWCGGCFISQYLCTFCQLGNNVWIFELVLTWYCCSGAYSEESEESPSISLSEVDSSSKSLIFLRSVSASSAL